MVPGLFNDVTSRVLRIAMTGLSQRQETIAGNIANVDTPDYKSLQINFESSLQQALGQDERSRTVDRLVAPHPRHIGSTRATDLDRVQPTTSTILDQPVRNDGNNVDIDMEMTDLAETQIRYAALSNLIGDRFQRLRLAITEGR